MNRRDFVQTPVALAAMQLAFLHDRAEAMDPVTLSIFLGLIAAGGLIFANKIAAEKSSQAQIEIGKMQLMAAEKSAQAQIQIAQMGFALRKMQEEFEVRKMKMQYGLVTVVEEVFVKRNGQPVKMLITKNIDGIGTEFGVNARYGTSRGEYNGTFSTVEAVKFGNGLERNKPMPVPVIDGYLSVPPAIGEKVERYMQKDERPFAIRPYSSADRPTKEGWDLATVLYANSNKSVNAKIIQRSQLG